VIEGLEFDDVLIRPMVSKVCSRDEVDISVKFSDNFTLKFPLIASPMVGVVDGKFASLLSSLGGIAIMHRFYLSRELLVKDIEDNLDPYMDNFGVSVKIGDDSFKELLAYNPQIILIDTANGYTDTLLRYADKVKNYITSCNLSTLVMAGNVATKEGCIKLANYGCDIIRVGIGGGSVCSTRNKTGVGVPSITSLEDCKLDFPGAYKIVFDGGIKNSGDFVKAIVAGADACMAGKLFAQCFEAPNDGILYGMASRKNMENVNLPIKSVEGFDTKIDKNQHLGDFVREFGYGIKSAGTYLNARNLEEIYMNGSFIRVTDSAIKKGI